MLLYPGPKSSRRVLLKPFTLLDRGEATEPILKMLIKSSVGESRKFIDGPSYEWALRSFKVYVIMILKNALSLMKNKKKGTRPVYGPLRLMLDSFFSE